MRVTAAGLALLPTLSAVVLPTWLGVVGFAWFSISRRVVADPSAGRDLRGLRGRRWDLGYRWLAPWLLCLAAAIIPVRGVSVGVMGSGFGLPSTPPTVNLWPLVAFPVLAYVLVGRELGASSLSQPPSEFSPLPFLWLAATFVSMAAHATSLWSTLFALEILNVCVLGVLAALADVGGACSLGNLRPLLVFYWTSVASAFATIWGLSFLAHSGANFAVDLSGSAAATSQLGHALVGGGLSLKAGSSVAGWWLWAFYPRLSKAQLLTYAAFLLPPILTLVSVLFGYWLPRLEWGDPWVGPLSALFAPAIAFLAGASTSCCQTIAASSCLGSTVIWSALTASGSFWLPIEQCRPPLLSAPVVAPLGFAAIALYVTSLLGLLGVIARGPAWDWAALAATLTPAASLGGALCLLAVAGLPPFPFFFVKVGVLAALWARSPALCAALLLALVAAWTAYISAAYALLSGRGRTANLRPKTGGTRRVAALLWPAFLLLIAPDAIVWLGTFPTN